MNEQKVHELALRVIDDMGGAFIMALGYIGDRLHLFKAMADCRPITSADLATRTRLNERYVREWLRAMTAAEYIDYDSSSHAYRMNEEQALVLANEDSSMFVGGGFEFTTPSLWNVPRIVEAFRHGGGIPYAEIGEEIPRAIERFFGPSYRNLLASEWVAAVPGLTKKLEQGANIADVGCGGGQSSVALAKAFPKSKVLGIDYHGPSLKRARKLAAANHLTNVQFIQAPADRLPRNGYDLVCSFDCIHDMVDPRATLRAIREALAPDGRYIWSEPNASAKPDQNRNPIGRTFQAISPLHCMTVSLAHNGEGLGTVIGEEGARSLAEEAGFSLFQKLPIHHPLNQFFVLAA
ncbi:MAG TPA: class I SAM-dependent methyltransferase [Terriglobales bacterium]|jgi:2-polyprenyl-3-methyl-5-hydroxy-6-metoxy-1,4-benzoquinol methylase